MGLIFSVSHPHTGASHNSKKLVPPSCYPTNVVLQILLCLTHVTMKHDESSGLASADPIVTISTTSPPEAPSFWPPYTSLPRGFPSHSLLVGTEALVWQSLGAVLGSDKTSHVTPTLALTKLESSAKQVALRQALRRIGLGWVATNTTPFRILAGKLYNRAVDQLKQLCSDSAVEDLSNESDHHRGSCPSAENYRQPHLCPR